MITIHWIWLFFIAAGCTCFGTIVMACLCAAARADRDAETYVHNLETGQWERTA